MGRISLATWNVNSIRARLEVVLRWLRENDPDILCLQELKVEESRFPAESFTDLGYHSALNAQKTWNGVATLSRFPFDEIRKGFGSGYLDEQKRLLSVRTAGVRIVNAYVPQGGDPSIDRFGQKLRFLEELRIELESLAGSDEPLALVGDMNVAPEEDDVFDPAELDGLVGFHPEERSRLRNLLEAGFVDLLRRYKPSGKVFSWWDYRGGAFRRNRGMRLDLILTNAALAERATGCEVDAAPRKWDKPSDHVPVVATFDIDTPRPSGASGGKK